MIFTPILFQIQFIISEDLSGTVYFQDISSVKSINFILNNSKIDSLIFAPQEEFLNNNSNDSQIINSLEIASGRNNKNNFEIICYNEQLNNQISYYNIKEDINSINNSIIYNQGLSKIIITPLCT